MEGMKKKLGFGVMRLPMNGIEIDIPQVKEMIDLFLENGFNYFDTAHGYLNGRCEQTIKNCLTSRYPRQSFILADKLSDIYFKKQEDIRPLFEKQLDACGVEYFDVYLMHAQDKEKFLYYKECKAYEVALELKAEGKIRHFGISFHDSAQVLEEILTEYPQIEVVQLQFNYLDFDDPQVQGRACYEVCRKYQKPVIVMEPVKGGNLSNLPEGAKDILDDLHGGSPASYAIRFAAGFEGVCMVLSGMSSLEQMRDNIGFMNKFHMLTVREQEAVKKVRRYLGEMRMIPCTGCRYCTDGCPKQIPVPDLFSIMNRKVLFDNWDARRQYYMNTKKGSRASDCVKCGQCEKQCPQHLKIRDLLEKVNEEFEK